MRREASRTGPWGLISSLTMCLAVAVALCPSTMAAGVEEAQDRPRVEIKTPLGQPLLPEDRERVVEAILSHPDVAPTFEGQRVRALRVALELAEDKEAAEPLRKLVATAVIFNYSTGQAFRYGLALATGELVVREELRGRPQASPEEITEATEIVRSAPEISRYLKEGAVLEGGFVVDPPETAAGKKLRHRYLQLHILTSDRSDILLFVTVDLTGREIAAVSPPRWRQ